MPSLLRALTYSDSSDPWSWQPLHWASTAAVVYALCIVAHADVDAKGPDNITPLFQAASLEESIDVVRALIALGADPNAVDLNGLSVLSSSTLLPTPKATILLLEAGADVNYRCTRPRSDFCGMTALMFAVEYHQSGSECLEVLRALLEWGADPTPTRPDGKSAVDFVRDSQVQRSYRRTLRFSPEEAERMLALLQGAE